MGRGARARAAATEASGIVAMLSLTNSTPPRSPTGSSRWASGRKPAQRGHQVVALDARGREGRQRGADVVEVVLAGQRDGLAAGRRAAPRG